MPIQKWSENILLLELTEEPQLSDDLQAVADRIDQGPPQDVVLNMKGVRHMNSSHISKLLRLRATMIQNDRELRICNVPDMIWGVMIVTGLDKVFHFSPDLPSALASLQLDDGQSGQRRSAGA